MLGNFSRMSSKGKHSTVCLGFSKSCLSPWVGGVFFFFFGLMVLSRRSETTMLHLDSAVVIKRQFGVTLHPQKC